MFVRNKAGRIIAQLRFQEGCAIDARGNREMNAELFRAMKFIPRNIMKVDVQYFGIGREDFQPLNEPRRRIMDITAALSDAEDRNHSEIEKGASSPRKMLFVAPATEKSPEDGVLTYSTVETLFDVARVAERSVILFRADQLPMLKCLAENEVLFDIELRVLTGLPATDYSADFDSTTWALEKVAYVPFLSELRLAAEMDAQLKAQNATAYDRERTSYTRKTGEVKEHKNFEVLPATIPSEGGDDEDIL